MEKADFAKIYFLNLFAGENKSLSLYVYLFLSLIRKKVSNWKWMLIRFLSISNLHLNFLKDTWIEINWRDHRQEDTVIYKMMKYWSS